MNMMNVRTIKELVKPAVRIDSQQTVLEAAKLMRETDRGSLVVMKGKIAVGIITERDFVKRVVAESLPYDTTISQVMSTPLVLVSSSTPLNKAADIMFEHKIRRLPVVEGGTLVGIVVASDFLSHLRKKTLTEGIWATLTGNPL